MYQKVLIRGRAYIDPQLRYIENGTPVVNYILVINRKNNNNFADKIPVVAWGETAKNIDKHIKKGDMAFYEGELRSSEWQDEEGKTHYQIQFQIDSFTKEFTKNNKKDEEPKGEEQNE